MGGGGGGKVLVPSFLTPYNCLSSLVPMIFCHCFPVSQFKLAMFPYSPKPVEGTWKGLTTISLSLYNVSFSNHRACLESYRFLVIWGYPEKRSTTALYKRPESRLW